VGQSEGMGKSEGESGKRTRVGGGESEGERAGKSL